MNLDIRFEFEPGFHHDLAEEVYHADARSLSSTGAKTILKSPALFKHQQTHPEHKDVYDVGTAFHTKTLGVGPGIAVFDGASFYSKAGREFQTQARANGTTPLLATDDVHTTEMARAVRRSTAAAPWLVGDLEVSAFCPDPATGVMRRGRMDVLGDRFITDLKSTTDASPEEFAKAAARFHYHQQAAWYLDLASDLGHPALGFAFIVVEKKPPYLVSVIELDEEALDLGRALNARALALYAACVEADDWPGYTPDGYATVSLPRWAFTEAVA